MSSRARRVAPIPFLALAAVGAAQESESACLAPGLPAHRAFVTIVVRGPADAATIAPARRAALEVARSRAAAGPVDADGWLALARERESEGDDRGAVAALERAVRLAPDDPRAHRALALALERAGDVDGARSALEDALAALWSDARSPEESWRVTAPDARLGLRLVELCRAEGDDDGAATHLATLAERYPCMEEAVLLRAELARAAGEPLAADALLRETLDRLEPGAARAAAHLDVARFYESIGDPDRAIVHLEVAWALGERREVVPRTIARVHVERGEFDRAASWLRLLLDRWLAERTPDGDTLRAWKHERRIEELRREIGALEAEAAVADGV